MNDNSILISVIIPTYYDWTRLALCLDALRKQTLPSESFEILVVNNAPDNKAPESLVLEKNVYIIEEKKPGSYAARNAALNIAKGQIIAFTDSDCIPDKDWLLNGLKFFQEHGDVERIAGHIELFYRSKSRNSAEIYESVYAFRQDIAVSLGVSVTGNMLAYRRLFSIDCVGLFNENLYSGGDSEWSIRAQKLGFKIQYGKNVIINHPARDDFSLLVSKSRRLAGHVRGGKFHENIYIFKLLLPPVKSFRWSKGKPVNFRLTAFFVKYYLNLVQFWESICIIFFKKNASRV